MKMLLLALALLAMLCTSAWAECTTTTYIINGKMTMCVSCCTGETCTVTCI